MRTIETFLERSVVESSRERMWPGLEVMTARITEDGLDVDGLRAHTLAINTGRPFRVEGRIDGRLTDSVMSTGAMKIVEAGPRSVWRWDAGEPIEMLHVSIADEALRTYAGELGLMATPEVRTCVGFADANLARIAEALATELQSPYARSLVADALRIELMYRLLTEHSSLASDAVRVPANRLGARTLRLLDDYIDAALGQNIGISDLAALVGMSRFHFARLFRATVGSTPHQYVLERRLERARELLRFDDVPLRDIATATGFSDQSHLTRHVKRRFGRTPAALRAS
jgi:AraC family transcriptional regulator